MSNVLRNMPSVSELLDSPPLKSLVRSANQNLVVNRVRQFLEGMRSQVQSAAANLPLPAVGELAQRIADWIATEDQAAAVPVINATGVIISEELGGTPLAEEAILALAAIARGYSLAGAAHAHSAGPRGSSAEHEICRLTGAEAALVVNNRAAANWASLAAIGAGREVVVARGQLVAEGEGYHLPELIAASGVRPREIGAANCVRIGDYAAAIGPATAAILWVIPGTFEIIGSREQPPLADVVSLAHKHGLPLIAEIGYGALQSLERYGLASEPRIGDSIQSGADLVLAAGDGWLGGPPCGIVAGRRALIERIQQHPLYSAARADKLRLAALAATLRLHGDSDLAERSLPVLSLLATPLENLQNRAERLAPQLAASGIAEVRIVCGQSRVTGTSLPRHALATVGLALVPRTGSAAALAATLRSGHPPVVGRLEGDHVLLDLRSVPPRDDAQLAEALRALAAPAQDASADDA
jgi:L-seryl-tRNA(Ser) seleniumtransferase